MTSKTDKSLETVPLSADAPLEDPAKDAFGYAPFAQHIARALVGMAPAEGFVISIHGPWGFGKTTLLNFVRYYLAKLPERQRPVVVAFNPWWFAGSDDLVGHFFRQLTAEFNKWGDRFKAVGNKLAALGEAVGEVPIPGFGIAKMAKGLRSRDRSIHDLRRDVEQLLRDQTQRIIVIVDDIDRLTSDETRQIFRVIKAVANLPNITYVLAYDQGRVATALDEVSPGSGLAYLEKIVQAPFDLPLPERSDIRKLFLNQLNQVIAAVPDEQFDQVRWANVFFDGIDHFISSPRAVVRMMNSLRLTYAAADGEVDPIDFIAIETIRVFAPQLYEQLRWNSDLLAGHANFRSDGGRAAEAAKLEALLGLVGGDDRAAVSTMLKRLFPRVDAMLGGMFHGAEWESEWRKNHRIASAEVFPVYFRLHVGAGQFRVADIRHALGVMSSAREFADLLIELSKKQQADGSNRARAFLDRLEDYTETDIPVDVIPSAVEGLALAGDVLLRAEPERRGFLDFGMDVQIARVAWRLLRRLPADGRYDVIARATQHSGLAVLVDWVDTLLAQHQPEREEAVRADPILTKGEAESVRDIGLEHIRVAARDGTLEAVPQLPVILARWRVWGAEGELESWLNERLSNDSFVVNLVRQYVQHTISLGLSDKAARTRARIDLKWVSQVVDVQKLLARVEEVNEGELDPDARTALQLYIDTASGKISDRD